MLVEIRFYVRGDQGVGLILAVHRFWRNRRVHQK